MPCLASMRPRRRPDGPAPTMMVHGFDGVDMMRKEPDVELVIAGYEAGSQLDTCIEM